MGESQVQPDEEPQRRQQQRPQELQLRQLPADCAEQTPGGGLKLSPGESQRQLPPLLPLLHRALAQVLSDLHQAAQDQPPC